MTNQDRRNLVLVQSAALVVRSANGVRGIPFMRFIGQALNAYRNISDRNQVREKLDLIVLLSSCWPLGVMACR